MCNCHVIKDVYHINLPCEMVAKVMLMWLSGNDILGSLICINCTKNNWKMKKKNTDSSLQIPSSIFNKEKINCKARQYNKHKFSPSMYLL